MIQNNEFLRNATTTQWMAFGILCVLEIYKTPDFVEWAEGWLSGEHCDPDMNLRILCQNQAVRAAMAGDIDTCSGAQAAKWILEAANVGRQALADNWDWCKGYDWKSSYERATQTSIIQAMACLPSEIDLASIAQKAMEY